MELFKDSWRVKGDVISALAALTGTILWQPSEARLVRIPLRVNFKEGKTVSRVFQGIKPGFAFDEVIPSWNIDGAAGGAIKIELKTEQSGWLCVGEWSGDTSWMPRASVKGQKDEYASVSTDTFRAKTLVDRVDLKVTLTQNPAYTKPVRLKLLTLCFANTKTTKPEFQGADSPLWGSLVDVPQRAQGNYPNGSVLCSATSTSMLLWHWSKVLNLPNMNKDVPEVEAAVWDPVYDGAGNWPFNTAYVGSMEGMKACVSRLTSLQDLERLTRAGIPVACSVSFDMLRGKPLSKGESGHLVLCVGFRSDGTPIINDPAFKDGVRKTYPREDFEKAWCYSSRTVYLMVPDSVKLPADPHRVYTFR